MIELGPSVMPCVLNVLWSLALRRIVRRYEVADNDEHEAMIVRAYPVPTV